MKRLKMPVGSLTTAPLAYGNMRCVGTWDPAAVTPEKRDEGVKSHIAAYEAGYTLFDTADIYCRGVCEQVLGQTLKEVRGMRAEVVVATKCGVRFKGDPTPDAPGRYDFSAEHITASCERSLKNLGVDTIDLYMLHRPDLLMRPTEVAEAFDALAKAGKVREFGVSNFLPSTVAALESACPMPLVVNQVEIHLGRLDCLFDGTLDQCLERGMIALSWSPLGGGWLGAGRTVDEVSPDGDRKRALLATLDATAAEWGVSRTVIALAWLLKHPAGIVPIVGSNRPENIRDAAKAADLDLTREQWYRILIAARGKAMP
jgi:predicted oxidoreductase